MIEQRGTTSVDRVRRACVEILVIDDAYSPMEAAACLGKDIDLVRRDLIALGHNPSGSRRRRKANASRRREGAVA